MLLKKTRRFGKEFPVSVLSDARECIVRECVSAALLRIAMNLVIIPRSAGAQHFPPEIREASYIHKLHARALLLPIDKRRGREEVPRESVPGRWLAALFRAFA